MDNNTAVRRLLRGMVIIGIMVAVALCVGLFFAFGGDNPLLIHVAHVIDMALVAITVLFVMGIVYVVYATVTHSGQPLFKSSKRSPNRKNDEIPELMELIDNLEPTE
jgi:predicted PurR-regulated permease PerM